MYNVQVLRHHLPEIVFISDDLLISCSLYIILSIVMCYLNLVLWNNDLS